MIIKKPSSFVDTAVLLPILLNLISQYHESPESTDSDDYCVALVVVSSCCHHCRITGHKIANGQIVEYWHVANSKDLLTDISYPEKATVYEQSA